MSGMVTTNAMFDRPEFVVHPRGGRRLHATRKVARFYRPLLLDQMGALPVDNVYAGFQSATLCGIDVGINGIPGSIKPNSKRSRCRTCVALAGGPIADA